MYIYDFIATIFLIADFMPILSANLIVGSEPGLILDEDDESPSDVSKTAFSILVKVVVEMGKSYCSIDIKRYHLKLIHLTITQGPKFRITSTSYCLSFWL